MILREAELGDIPQMQHIRNSVKENSLSDPNLVNRDDYVSYLKDRGKGWVVEEDGCVLGFSIIDLQEKNVWALFVWPDAEGKGLGRSLHDHMLNWYFRQTKHPVWLSTAAGTRAEAFYRKAGWQDLGAYGKGEIKFEMSAIQWQTLKKII